MTNLLLDNKENEDICIPALECLLNMPLIHRNKVEDSKIEGPVQGFLESQNEKLAELSKKVRAYSTLIWPSIDLAQPPVHSHIFPLGHGLLGNFGGTTEDQEAHQRGPLSPLYILSDSLVYIINSICRTDKKK